MKKLSFLFVITAILVTSTWSSYGQALNTPDYNTAIGLRVGGTSGITIKHFMGGGPAAFEGIIGLWPNALSLTGLYEKHANAGASGLKWYYGGGAHVAFISTRYHDRGYYYYRDSAPEDGVGIGIDGIVGIEYKINPIPFAISLDLKPFIELNTMGGTFWAIDPALGIKFTF
jgi:hypothetical protein